MAEYLAKKAEAFVSGQEVGNRFKTKKGTVLKPCLFEFLLLNFSPIIFF